MEDCFLFKSADLKITQRNREGFRTEEWWMSVFSLHFFVSISVSHSDEMVWVEEGSVYECNWEPKAGFFVLFFFLVFRAPYMEKTSLMVPLAHDLRSQTYTGLTWLEITQSVCGCVYWAVSQSQSSNDTGNRFPKNTLLVKISVNLSNFAGRDGEWGAADSENVSSDGFHAPGTSTGESAQYFHTKTCNYKYR